MGMPGNWQSSGKLRHAESQPGEVWECEKMGGLGAGRVMIGRVLWRIMLRFNYLEYNSV